MNLFVFVCLLARLISFVWAKNDSNCGQHHHSEIILGIINGTAARSNPREFPWVGGLAGFTSDQQIKECGASILNKRWILTAAHCVHEQHPLNLIRTLVFFAGRHFEDPDVNDVLRVRRNIEEIVIHPHYKRIINGSSINDIALLKLDADLDLSLPQLAPICLPYRENLDKRTKMTCVAVGWGSIDSRNGHLPTVLQKSSSKIWKQSECGKYLKTKGEPKLVDSKLCWGGHGETSGCSGDSGGPLLCQTKIDDQLVWAHGLVWCHVLRSWQENIQFGKC